MNAAITNSSGGSLALNADNTGTGIGTIIFSGVTPQITMSGGGAVTAYYNPVLFTTPTNFATNVAVSGGTTFTPYMLVNTFVDLQNMSTNLSGNYALGRNIDASAGPFTPVGTSATSFTGQFDGQNYIIDSLTIALPLASEVGLFGAVNSSGTIQNVGLTNATITGLMNVGALIGLNTAGTVNNAYSTGSVTSAAISNNVGGLIGFSSGNINNSYSTVSVLAGAISNYIGGLVGKTNASISNSYHTTGFVSVGAASTYVGGLAGYTLGTVSNSYNTGAVTIGATGSLYEGGLIGYSVGTVSGSYNTGSVTAGAAVTHVGGLIGYAFGSVNTSYSSGAINTGATGSANIGGLIGYANNNVTNSYSHSSILGGAGNVNLGGLVGQNKATISNTYSMGSVASGAGSSTLGGLVGLNTGTVANSFWDTQTSGQLASDGGAGRTTVEMMQQTTFCLAGSCSGDLTQFDFANIWGIQNGVTYPYLQALTFSISGQVFSNIGGATPVAGNTISLASAGVVLSGAAITAAQATSDITGYYYFLLNKSYFSQTSPVLAFVSAGPTVGNTLFTPSATPITVNIYGNTIYNQGTGVLSNALLAITKGSLVDTGILYSASGNNLSLGNAINTTANFVTSINTPYTINGNITPITGGSNTFTFNGPVTVSGNSIVLAGQVFTNNAAAFTLNTGGGTFLVWSTNPAADTRGNIAYNFKQYNATFGTTPVLGTGAGFLYTVAPVITPSLTGTVTKSYDTNTTATLASGNYANTGAIDGDTVILNNPTSGLYDTKDVGVNKNVSVSGLAIASATNGSVTVYGYQLASNTANANIGIITPATLTYTANTGTMAYGSTVPALSGTITGFMGSETAATATTGILSFASPASSTSNVGNYAVNGSGLTANNGNYLFTQAAGNTTALAITPATLTYTANAGTMTYGGTVPPLSGTVTGFVGTETQATATTGILSFASPASSTSNVGNYAVNGSGLTANNGNYLFTQAASNAAAFSVTPAIPVVVTVTPVILDVNVNPGLINNVLPPETTISNLADLNTSGILDLTIIDNAIIAGNKTAVASDVQSIVQAGILNGVSKLVALSSKKSSNIAISENIFQENFLLLLASLLALLLMLLTIWGKRRQVATLDTQWVSGTSTVATAEGLLYVAVIIDLYSRAIVGWAMQETSEDLVKNAVIMAAWRRRITPGLISQSNQGNQDATQDAYQVVLQTNGQHAWDNGIVENFFRTLKIDLISSTGFLTREQAKQSIFEYIEVIYNRVHSHSHLGYQASLEFEKNALAA